MSAKTSIVKKAFSAGMPIAFGMYEFQSRREEGHGLLSSTAYAAADYALSEAMQWKYPLMLVGSALPSVAVSAMETINSINRSQHAINANTPFYNGKFIDNAQSATMRQAGMQLAKQSRYNLEQTLMGNEAAHIGL